MLDHEVEPQLARLVGHDELDCADAHARIGRHVATPPPRVRAAGPAEVRSAHGAFEQPADVADDMNTLMRKACVLLDGKGGGKPDMAQGGGKNVEKLEEAIKLASGQ